MATYSTKRETMLTCPFNPAHQVRSTRYQIHITKCKRYHPGMDIYRCPFSPDHVVEPSKLMHHVYTCPLNTTEKRYQSKLDIDVVRPKVPTIKAAPDIQPKEDWDEEARKPQTSKGKTAQRAVRPVFADVQAMAPAQRRKFYVSLREKVNEPTSGDVKPSSLKKPATKKPEEAMNDQPVVFGVPEQPRAQLQNPWGKAPFLLDNGVVKCYCDYYEDEDGELQVYYMRARPGLFTVTKDSDLQDIDDEAEKEAQARMRLMGYGRDRNLN
ncbi:hypothetical protein MRX96_024693 [Rhipicephalus microplus]